MVSHGPQQAISFEDLDKAQAEHTAEEAEKEAEKARQTSKALRIVEETAEGKGKRGRERKDNVTEGTPEPEAHDTRVSRTPIEWPGNTSRSFRAPVARMW
nr:hypothetical protein B0A51_00931 [Rachicladosporium sp. CCFEE 5018]